MQVIRGSTTTGYFGPARPPCLLYMILDPMLPPSILQALNHPHSSVHNTRCTIYYFKHHTTKPNQACKVKPKTYNYMNLQLTRQQRTPTFCHKYHCPSRHITDRQYPHTEETQDRIPKPQTTRFLHSVQLHGMPTRFHSETGFQLYANFRIGKNFQ